MRRRAGTHSVPPEPGSDSTRSPDFDHHRHVSHRAVVIGRRVEKSATRRGRGDCRHTTDGAGRVEECRALGLVWAGDGERQRRNGQDAGPARSRRRISGHSPTTIGLTREGLRENARRCRDPPGETSCRARQWRRRASRMPRESGPRDLAATANGRTLPGFFRRSRQSRLARTGRRGRPIRSSKSHTLESRSATGAGRTRKMASTIRTTTDPAVGPA